MERKLNIGLFIDTYYPMIDGVIVVVDNYAKRLSKFANVTVFCPHGKTPFVDNFDYKVVRCKSLKFKADYTVGVPRLDRKFKKALKESNLDLVHIHSPFGVGKIGMKYAKKHNIPLLATSHSQYRRDFYKATHINWLSNLLLKNIMKVFNACEECWAVNSETQKVFVNDYKLKAPSKIQRNATRFDPKDDTTADNQEVNKLYNLTDDEKIFLFVGRIIELKNVFFIAESLKLVKQAGIKFKMLYAGAGPDEERLKDKVKELGIQDQVVFCGKVTDPELLRKIYARADLFLFPSLYDASSLVQIEAASQRTPTVFIRGSVTAGTVTEDVNGFLTEENTEDFANKIIQICNNPEYYKKVQEGALRDLYVSWDEVIEDVINDYQTFLDKYNNPIKLKK